jgi:hypothetical protein
MSSEERAEYRYSVIIAVTHNLVDLRDCLDSLERLEYSRHLFRVALIDCHVVEGLQDFFRTCLPLYTFPITAFSLPESPVRHVSWLHEARVNEARNAAMEKAPAQYFIYSEDDCTFERDWLIKFDLKVQDDTGALGGPDLLPHGMPWLPRSLDWLLQSFVGTAGAKRGGGLREDWYYARKENLLIPAKVISRIGVFPENIVSGAEMEMARRIRAAGLTVRYLPDNPVWHRRTTTFRNLIRRNIYHSAEKVRLLRRQRAFSRSPHFIILLAVATGLLLGTGALMASALRISFLAGASGYLLLVLFVALQSLVGTRKLTTGLGLLLLVPSHHLSIAFGVLKGALSRKSI